MQQAVIKDFNFVKESTNDEKTISWSSVLS